MVASSHTRHGQSGYFSSTQIAIEFNNGTFTVHKTRRSFSHPWPLTRFMSRTTVLSSYWSHSISCSSQKIDVPGPEVVKMTTEFEVCIHKSTTSDERHHKQSRSSQVNFAQQVQGMVEVIEEMGNPFMEETKDLLDWT